MIYDNDDPRLTAYALGELEPSETAEVERLIAENEDARKLVDEIRQTARWIADGLKQEHESAATLSLDNHRLIEKTLEKNVKPAAEHAPGGGAPPRSRRSRPSCWAG